MELEWKKYHTTKHVENTLSNMNRGVRIRDSGKTAVPHLLTLSLNDRHPVANSIFTPQFLLAEEVNYQITSGLPWQNDSEHLQKLNQERG